MLISPLRGLAIALPLISGTALAQWLAERRDKSKYPPPGRVVHLTDADVHVVVEGSGPPVLFDSGLGGSSIEWGRVAADLAAEFTVIRYDRPGFAWSPDTDRDRRAVAAARRMTELLRAVDVSQPAILVGHSLGGIHVRAAAAISPELVGGLVLVDPSHEGMLDLVATSRAAAVAAAVLRVISSVAPFGAGRVMGRPLARMALSEGRLPLDDEARHGAKLTELLTCRTVHGLRAMAAEHACLHGSLHQFAELIATSPEPDVPVTVITGSAPSPNNRIAKAREQIDGLHAELVAGCVRGRHVLAERSGHLVPLDQPELVAQCVRETAAAMRINA
jgi:pimeloyl-ACP methyl ester carboxylesterase